MSKKFKASTWKFSIEEIDVQYETQQFVVLPTGRREKKKADSGVICDSREEAENWVLNHHRTLVDDAERMLAYRKKDLAHALSLYGNAPPAG